MMLDGRPGSPCIMIAYGHASAGRVRRGRRATERRGGPGGSRSGPFCRDGVVLAVPRGHRLADRTVRLDELKSEPLVLMQEGAGVRQVIEEELRAVGVRLRDLDVQLELGLQESARSAVLAGYGVTFISRSAIESDLAAGTVAVARVEGLEPSPEISLVRSAGRAETRAAQAFVEYARSRLA